LIPDQKFLCISSYSQLSLLETVRIKDSGIFDFEILESTKDSVLLQCSQETGKALAKKFGGIFKIVRACGSSIEDLTKSLPLPESSKFNWTISGYGCDLDTYEGAKVSISDFLKSESLGKSRFVKSDEEGDVRELRLSDLVKTVLTKNNARIRGLDVVVDSRFGKPLYGYTEFTSDIDGFGERDFGRPYQDPTVTIGPRLARVLVNLCGLRKGKTILDPFCGLGTILQEAMIAGHNAVGIELSGQDVMKSRKNLDWMKKQFQISPKLSYYVTRADTFRIEKENLPKIDAIATEPILIPKLEKNPTAAEAGQIIRNAKIDYENAFRAFSRILEKDGKISIVVPEVVDDRGRGHSIDLESMSDLGFAVFHPKVAGLNVENPCSVPTTKKKIIRRKVYLMTLV
jgi:tRNA G10  N-methylase Trm11